MREERKKGDPNRRMQGQVGILLVLGMFVLLAVAALVVDGIRLLSDRRSAQDAADSAAIAGAFEMTRKLDFGQVITASLGKAGDNGYTNDGVHDVVDIEISGPFNDRGLVYLITIKITTQIDSVLAHLVYPGDLKGTVVAVSRVRPQQNITEGYAMFGSSPDACQTIYFSGSGTVNVSGGGIFSNSAADGSTNTACTSGVQAGSGDINVSTGGITSVGTFRILGSGGSISPAPQTGVPSQELPKVFTPDCTGLPEKGTARYVANQTATIEPGIYDEITFGAGANITMMPGMYCIQGSQGFTGNGGVLNGSGVMIYMKQGSFDLGGNTSVNLSAPVDLQDPAGNQWARMLLYVDPTNTNQVLITGTENSLYSGTIYAPGSSCEVSGNGDSIGVSSQLICNTVNVSGSANVSLSYDQLGNYQLPSLIELIK